MTGTSGPATSAPQLISFLDAFLAWFYRANPVSATFIGVHEHDYRLPDWSEHGRGDLLASINHLAAQLNRLPPEPLTEGERLDRALAASSLEVLRWEATAPQFAAGNPAAYTGEAVFSVIALLLRRFSPLDVRVEAAVERMTALPEFLAQGRANVRHAPRAWTGRAIRECEGALAFFERGVELFAREEGVEHPRWRQAAQAAAEAFQAFHAHLSDLQEGAGDGYACGGEALERLIHRGHWLAMDTAEVLSLGQAHLAAATARLEVEAKNLGIEDWREGLRRLSDRYPDAARYYARFTEVWVEAKAAAEAHGLVTWPDYPIRYVAQPAWAREAAPSLYFLFYRAPAAFDRIPIVEYLVTPVEPEMAHEEQQRRLRAANDSVITLNHVAHHGGLGHHVQNWYAYHRAASRIGQIAAVDGASRIALFCGGTTAEGWACYATDLMEEIGFLTPFERLAQAHGRLRIAARAVADVQLHTGAWTLEETADFYHRAAAMPAEAARAEAVKNSMSPGTALMYLTGNEAIHGLRAEMRGRQGYTARAFHDRLLSYGSVPVALIAQEMLRDGLEPIGGAGAD